MRLRVAGGLVAFAVLAACRPEPQPAPAPRPTEDASLRPLTSRDGGQAASPNAGAVDPHGSSNSLPPGHPPLDTAHPPGAAAGPADTGASISGTVDAAPKTKEGIRGGALFLIARNAKTRQIVAVRKADSVTLPQKFQLSGADAMVPGTPFEGPLDVTARWSQAGDAMPAPGDIEGVAKGVAVGAADVKLILADVRK
jgi:cytochrome c-type biogenesis protein CcmH